MIPHLPTLFSKHRDDGRREFGAVGPRIGTVRWGPTEYAGATWSAEWHRASPGKDGTFVLIREQGSLWRPKTLTCSLSPDAPPANVLIRMQEPMRQAWAQR